MTFSRLVSRSLAFHWPTNVPVALGVAAAVSVLAGALLVGASVRGSLRDLATSRLGRTVYSVTTAGYVGEELAADLAKRTASHVAPLVATSGVVTHETSGRRAAGVAIYGIDERFWRFHGLEPRDGVFVSPALARELTSASGDVLLVRLQRPSALPLESLFAHKDDGARSVRLTVAETLPADRLGEFALRPQQGDVRAVFAPLRRLQRELAVPSKVNALLVDPLPSADAAALDAAAVASTGTERLRAIERELGATASLDDLGITVDVSDDRSWVMVGSTAGVINERLDEPARRAGAVLGVVPQPIFTYLANTIRVGDREVPYSLVAGLDLRLLPGIGPADSSASASTPALGGALPTADAIVLNDWLARELQARQGDQVDIDYYVWDAAAGLQTRSATFRVFAVVPMQGVAADRRLAPDYPGITGAENVADWDPPFPVDLSRVKPRDEAYWHEHRATPKAFVRYERAQELWATRYGGLTGLRFAVPPSRPASALADDLRARLREAVTPQAQGLVVLPVRAQALTASAGATNFAEYFTYFSFFIVFSALLLMVLFFRVGVEQRLRQIGVLRAAGYAGAHVRRLLLSEAAILALAGSALGIAGAILYARVVVYGLTTWWVGAVGTTRLSVHVDALSLLAGAAGGVMTALVCVAFASRAVARRSPRALLSAWSLDQPAMVPGGARRRLIAGVVAGVAGLGLLAVGFVKPAAQTGAFFGAGGALLTALLSLVSAWLHARDRRPIAGAGWWALARLGFRAAAFRPGRSTMSAALIASAAFIIVSVDAFRRGGGELTRDPQSGTGAYALLATADLPLVHNPNSPAGREELAIQSSELTRTVFARFRLRPGEDASCLNLYKPGNPTLIAPEQDFIDRARFAFAASMADTDDERRNPWLLLNRRFDDGAVAAIADATSLQYVLHLGVGDTMSIDIGAAAPLVLRFVAALSDSVLQGQLVIGEQQFVRHFPGDEGFRFFLIDAPDAATPEQVTALAAVVERELEPYGVDAVSTVERLEAFHRVENTYLSTFQALGGLGLVLGTIGVATVMFRNVLERRRELALLRAVGYDARAVRLTILAETAFLVGTGLAAGAGGAAIAVAPAWLGHGGGAPGTGLLLLLAGVAAAALLSAAVAARLASSGSVLAALRAE